MHLRHARSSLVVSFFVTAAYVGVGCAGTSADGAAGGSGSTASASASPDSAAMSVAVTERGDAATPLGFELAPIGCAMGHCTPLADDSDLLAPPSTATRAWSDTTVSGANVQVGCSGNGSVAVCGLSSSHGDAGAPTLVAYNADGSHAWTYAGTSGFPAPLVDVRGGAMAANADEVVRITAGGTVMWTASGPGGAPKSGTPVGDAFLFLATSPQPLSSPHAPVATYDTVTGRNFHSYEVVSPPGSRSPTYYYSTGNSPAVSGNRAYVVMSRARVDGKSDSCAIGRLVAFDIASDGSITEAWRSAAFEGPSGASPMVVGNQVFFDGAEAAPPGNDCVDDDGTPLRATAASQISGYAGNASGTDGVFFGLVDQGTTATFQWVTSLGGASQANSPRDPRGGLWAYPLGVPALYHLDLATGARQADSFFDLTKVVPGAISVASDMTMSGSATSPILLLSVLTNTGNKVCALDLAASVDRVLWCQAAGVAAGQFPIVDDAGGNPVVVYATAANGIQAIGAAR